jgi:SnoaL-like polyketide cyclase
MFISCATLTDRALPTNGDQHRNQGGRMKSLRKTITALLSAFSLTTGDNAMAQNTLQENKQLLADFSAEVFNKKELSNLHRYMREDYIQHDPLVPQGLTGFKQFFADWFNAVPD